MKEAGSLQRAAWHSAGPDSECKVEAIDFNSAPQPRGDQSQERSSSLKSYADLPRPSTADAPRGFPRMTVAYRSQYPAAQTGESPEESSQDAKQSADSQAKEWSGRPGSNRRRPAWEAGILPLKYTRSEPSLGSDRHTVN